MPHRAFMRANDENSSHARSVQHLHGQNVERQRCSLRVSDSSRPPCPAALAISHQVIGESVKTARPHRAAGRKPALGFKQRRDPQSAGANAACLDGLHQPRVAEDLEMLMNGGE